MSKHSLIAAIILALAIAATSCIGSGVELGDNVVAERFLGSSPVSVSAPDSDDGTMVSIADDMVSGRRFDLTPSGFTIASGDITSEAPPGSDFGVSDGTLDVSGDQATVDFRMFSTNPDVTDARMTGTFSLSEATQALTSPGDSFLVNWDISFDYLGFPVQLQAEQELTGTDFRDLED